MPALSVLLQSSAIIILHLNEKQRVAWMVK
jgi:hypothetical protein